MTDDIDALAEAEEAPPIDLEKATQVAIELRDALETKRELEERLAEARREVHRLRDDVVPDVFDQLGIDHVGVPPAGNRPGFDVRVKPHAEANIAASWPEERRERAFAVLEEQGHGDLIKRTVAVDVPRGPRAAQIADEIGQVAMSHGLVPSTKKNVHPQTLSAWLRGEIKANRPLPPLDDIGAYLAMRAEIKERK